MPVAKKTQFLLPLDDVNISSIDELRQHCTLHILAYYHSGVLDLWLKSHRLKDALKAVAALTEIDYDDLALADGLCTILEIDPTVAAAMRDQLLAQRALEQQELEAAMLEADSRPIDSTPQDLWRYTDLGDGTVLDQITGLQWMRCALGQIWYRQDCIGKATQVKWGRAEFFASQHCYGGYSDWRLPTMNELETLVVLENKPTIDHRAFPNTPAASFWSNDADSLFYSFRRQIDFANGMAHGGDRRYAEYARFVRGGKS